MTAALTPGAPVVGAQFAQFQIQQAVTGQPTLVPRAPLTPTQRDAYVRTITDRATNPAAPESGALKSALNTIGANGQPDLAATQNLVAQSINSNVNARVTSADQLATLVDPSGGSFTGGSQLLGQVRDGATLARTSELLMQRAQSFGPQRYTPFDFQGGGQGVPAITAAADVASMAAANGSPAMIAPVINEIASARDVGGGAPLARYITTGTTGGNPVGATGGAVLTTLLTAAQGPAARDPAVATSADQIFADIGSFDANAPDGYALTASDRAGLGAYFTANATRISNSQPAAAAAALNTLDTPVARFAAAHNAVEKANGHLGQLLVQAGPLTAAQTKAFVDQYRSSNPAYADEVQDGQDAAAFLSANQDAMLRAAGSQPSLAGQLTGFFNDMTKAGRGADVLPTMGAIETQPTIKAAFDRQPGYNEGLKADTLISAQAQLLGQTADVPEAARHFLEIAEPLFRDQEGFSSVAETYKMIAKGDGTESLFTSSAMADSFKKLGGLGGPLAVASFSTSLALGNVNQGNFTTQLYNYLTASQIGTGFTAGLVTGLSDSFRLASQAPRTAEALAGFSQFASRAVPFLGLAATGVNFYNDINDGKDHPIFYMAAVGDVISSVGAAMQVIPTPPTEVSGALISGVGAIASAPFTIIGSMQKQNEEDAALRTEVATRLSQLPENVRPNSAAIYAMATSDIDETAAWKNAGMTPEQLQDLASRNPTFLKNASHNGDDVSDIPAMERRIGLSGTEFHDMLASADNSAYGGAGAVLRALELNSSTIRYAPSQSDMARQLREKATHEPYPEFAAALDAAAQYLQPL